MNDQQIAQAIEARAQILESEADALEAQAQKLMAEAIARRGGAKALRLVNIEMIEGKG